MLFIFNLLLLFFPIITFLNRNIYLLIKRGLRGVLKINIREFRINQLVKNLFILIIAIAFFSQYSFAICDPEVIPQIYPLTQEYLLKEGELFSISFNTTNYFEDKITFSHLILSGPITGINFTSNGLFSINPGKEDSGKNVIAILAYSGECIVTKIITLDVVEKPSIYDFFPGDLAFKANNSQIIPFYGKAKDSKDSNINYTWILNGKINNISSEIEEKNKFKLVLDDNATGLYNLTLIVTNKFGLTSDIHWKILVNQRNKPPVLINRVPGIVVFKDTATQAYTLNDYFIDPEKEPLKFSYQLANPQNESTLTKINYADILVNITNEGYVTFYPKTGTLGFAFFIFNATDIFGDSIASNIVKTEIMTKFDVRNVSLNNDRYCGDLVCLDNENCTSCPFDCGSCSADVTGCIPQWNCTGWDACLPIGVQYRTCIDNNKCEDNRTRPDILKFCRYDANCEDGLKNGIEEGVDCGGPCEDCATCSDNKINQGEEGVDCGGPCDPCATCEDGYKNQDETDIDCGGLNCKVCIGGAVCSNNQDCESQKCVSGICEYATCNDQIKNQKEDGIDCGGPCEAICNTCSDKIMNGNELGVDCGGICGPCSNCTDGVKNQDEFIVDCGGICGACSMSNLFSEFSIFILSAGLIILMLIGGWLIYYYTAYSRPESAAKIYEHRVSFGYLHLTHRYSRPLRILFGRKNQITTESINISRQKLDAATKNSGFTNKELHDAIYDSYKELLSLPDHFDYRMLSRKMSLYRVPHFPKMLLMGYYKKTEILLTSSFIPSEIKEDFINEFKFILYELSKP